MTTANDRALRRNLARMLAELGADEYAGQLAAHRRAGRSSRTFRYSPGPFHVVAVETLGRADSEQVAATIHADELRAYLGVTRA